jgi:hypothetical protein
MNAGDHLPADKLFSVVVPENWMPQLENARDDAEVSLMVDDKEFANGAARDLDVSQTFQCFASTWEFLLSPSSPWRPVSEALQSSIELGRINLRN